MTDNTVLVTGGTGYVAGHVLLRLLAEGHRVRTTVRSLDREARVRAQLPAAGQDRLEFVQADLTSDEGWAEAVAGCAHVLHVASPLPAGVPRHEDELVVPAREGTLRVLRAAHAAGVRRVVLTGSFAAVGYGYPPRAEPFTEESWTVPDGPGVTAYVKSKLLAEQAAWDYAREVGLDLVVLNPVGVFGPVLGPGLSASVGLIRLLLDRALPLLPRMGFGVVDVRDLADLHLLAMTRPEAGGQRFLAVAGPPLTYPGIARLLRARGFRVRTRSAPDSLFRLAARFSPRLRPMLANLGVPRAASAAKARRVLGWAPRPAEDTMVDTARSLL